MSTNGLATRKGKVKNKNEDEFVFQLEVVKLRKNREKLSRVRKQFALFSGCSSRIAFYDLDLCLVEILLVVSIVVLVV